MDYKTIMDDPFLAGIVITLVATVGSGLALIWKALTKAIVRALDKLAPEHTGSEIELVRKVREHEGGGTMDSIMLAIAPGSAISRQLKARHSGKPPAPEIAE